MRKLITRCLLLVVVVVISGYCSLAPSAKGQLPFSNSVDLALVGARIYPSPAEEPLANGVVLISNGKITTVDENGKIEIPPRSQVVDCTGLTLTAGFWNSHVHFSEPKWQNASSLPASQLAHQLQEMLTRYGFTHVVDTGSYLENTVAIKQRIESREISGPSIRTTGLPFVPPNGSPFYIAPIRLPELPTPEEAVKLVRERIRSGADAIKIFSASPAPPDQPAIVMSLDIAKAAVATAHAMETLVIAHPTNNAGLNVALEASVDVLAHTTPDGGEPWGEELVRKLHSAHVALMPTLKLWRFELERNGAAKEMIEEFIAIALQQLSAYSQAGGEILFGTDVGYVTDYNPNDEYILMAKADMTFQQILKSLTTAPAKRFGLFEKTGRIAPGMDADIAILGSDPATDVQAFSNVRYTLRAGKMIYQSTLLR
jgi:imidazolonepropionase-like amidohydrolase